MLQIYLLEESLFAQLSTMISIDNDRKPGVDHGIRCREGFKAMTLEFTLTRLQLVLSIRLPVAYVRISVLSKLFLFVLSLQSIRRSNHDSKFQASKRLRRLKSLSFYLYCLIDKNSVRIPKILVTKRVTPRALNSFYCYHHVCHKVVRKSVAEKKKVKDTLVSVGGVDVDRYQTSCCQEIKPLFVFHHFYCALFAIDQPYISLM